MNEMDQLERMCAEVPSPDQQRLAASRAELMIAVARSRRPAASRAARRLWLAVFVKRPRRWLGWVAPLAAAAAYVASEVGSVTQILTATGTALAPISAGRNPQAIAITPDGKTAYVANVMSVFAYQTGLVTPRTAQPGSR